MSWSLGIAIYFIIWWIVLFAVLPWGVHSQDESGEVSPGTDPGAPAVHLVWKKLMWTTVTAGVIFALCYGLYRFDLIPLDWVIAVSNPPHL